MEAFKLNNHVIWHQGARECPASGNCLSLKRETVFPEAGKNFPASGTQQRNSNETAIYYRAR